MNPAVIDENILLCPYCGGGNLHQGMVEVWNRRREDSEDGLHAVISDHVCIETSMHGNPSSRRQGLAVWFECESCGDGIRLTIAQHKGTTYVRFDAGPEEALHPRPTAAQRIRQQLDRDSSR